MKESVSKQTRAYPLRIPKELREKAERKAREEGRSLHGELVYRLSRAYQLPEAA